MKRGKYAGATFTPDQKKARYWWEDAGKQERAIIDALRFTDPRDRAECHARLDQALDRIEVKRSKAKGLFPEVDESFTIASMTIDLA